MQPAAHAYRSGVEGSLLAVTRARFCGDDGHDERLFATSVIPAKAGTQDTVQQGFAVDGGAPSITEDGLADIGPQYVDQPLAVT